MVPGIARGKARLRAGAPRQNFRVIGATGNAGSRILAELTLRGHDVTVTEVHRNLPPGALYEHAIRYEKDASIADNGALDSGEIVEGDAVVIAMGPWSILATRWLPLPAVFGYKGQIGRAHV